MSKIYRLVKFSSNLPTGDYIVIRPHGRASNYHHVNGHEDVIGIEWVFEPITLPASIEERAKELFPLNIMRDTSYPFEETDTNEEYRNNALQLATEAVAMKDAEIERLKGVLKEIDKSLYLGEGLDDTDILKWYVDVVSVIKDEIKQLLNS